ncbi:hypothetical protein JCM5353_001444 [Sporobolomyces roseus]
MSDSPRISTPRQLPTPADSPILLRSDSAAFRLSPSAAISSIPTSGDFRSGSNANRAEVGEETESIRLYSRRSSTSYSNWSAGDRFIPRRRASSQTSFDLLPSPSITSLPRSRSAPSQLRSFTDYSAHDAATEQEYSQLLRSELFGPTFFASKRQQSLEQAQSSSSHRLSRQSSSNSPFTASQRQTEIQSTVLSYSQERYPSTGLATPHASPFSKLYRLSPFNPTTDQLLSASPQLPRKISLTPCRVLDAPNLSGNFYDSVIDWSTSNGLLAVGLGPQAYTWKSTGEVVKVVDVDTDDLSTASTVSSVKWIDKSDHLAIGKSKGEVSIYDARTSQQVRQLVPHASRVGVLASLPQTLTSGSADRTITHRDLRVRDEVVRVIKEYKGEVTALEWNSSGEFASGGNDNSVKVFKGFEESQKPFLKLRQAHSAAIKALAWNPHQSGMLATGGGTNDQHIKIWSTRTGKTTREIDTGSQVCQIAWSKSTNEFVSSHGYSSKDENENCIHVWKNSQTSAQTSDNPTATLGTCRGRMLHLALSPDGRYVVCGSSDEILRFVELVSVLSRHLIDAELDPDPTDFGMYFRLFRRMGRGRAVVQCLMRLEGFDES